MGQGYKQCLKGVIGTFQHVLAQSNLTQPWGQQGQFWKQKCEGPWQPSARPAEVAKGDWPPATSH